MEQHPIPRDISGFQFKLIGDMTLKQFGYLLVFSVSGYILFKILPMGPVINAIIGGITAFCGIIFAFIPFQDRPVDQWIFAFVKSVYSPTQFIYFKQNEPPSILTSNPVYKNIAVVHHQQMLDSKKLLDNYLAKIPLKPTDSFDRNENRLLAEKLALFAIPVAVKTPTTFEYLKKQTSQPPPSVSPLILEANKKKDQPKPVHAPQKVKKETVLQNNKNQNQTVDMLKTQLVKMKKQVDDSTKMQKTDPLLQKRFLELEQKLTTLLTERERLTQEIAKLKNFKTYEGQTVTPKAAAPNDPTSDNVKIISQQAATRIGILNPPAIPNLVIGIIKDYNQLSLPNILITVKDLRGTPLRALKTNNLGQFFASTPLPNGSYILEVEDPMKKYVFDLIQIKLTGQIVQPLEITSKVKSDPARERIAKELFQKNF